MSAEAGRPRSRRQWAVVGVAFLVVALAAEVWLMIDTRPWEWDHANHLERVVHCAKDLATGDVWPILVPVPGRAVGLVADEVRVAGVRVPQMLVGWIMRNYDPTLRMASRLPAPVEIGRVVVDRTALRIVAAR